MQTISIAIIDDNHFIIQSVQDRLSFFDEINIGFTANSGTQAIEKLQNQPDIDLILMDIGMPDMNGIEATKLIKQTYPNIKIIMLTVFDDDDNILKAIQAGADGYLLKEINPEDLYQAITDTLQGGAAMTPSVAMKALRLLRNPSKAQIENTEYNDVQLSKREVEILEELSNGLTYSVIAEKLFVAPKTVRKHIENIYQKLQVHSKIEAVKEAQKRNLI